MLVFSLLVFCSAAPPAAVNSSSSDSSGQQPLNVGMIAGVAVFGFVWCGCFCTMLYSTTAGCSRTPVFGRGGGGGGGDGGGDGDGGGGGDGDGGGGGD